MWILKILNSGPKSSLFHKRKLLDKEEQEFKKALFYIWLHFEISTTGS